MSITNSYTVHELRGYIQSTYLIEYPDKLLLFDSGCRGDTSLILNYIKKELHRPLSDLKLIALTHSHPDHAGGAKILKEHTGALLAGPIEVNQWYKGLQGLIKHKVDFLLTHYVARKMKKKYKPVRYPRFQNLDVELEEGDRLPHFEDWLVFKGNGHTYGDLSFYHKEASTLYVADNIIKSRRGFMPPHPLTVPKDYKNYLKRYIECSPKTYWLAHGGIQNLSSEIIEKVIDKTPDQPRTHRRMLKDNLFKRAHSSK